MHRPLLDIPCRCLAGAPNVWGLRTAVGHCQQIIKIGTSTQSSRVLSRHRMGTLLIAQRSIAKWVVARPSPCQAKSLCGSQSPRADRPLKRDTFQAFWAFSRTRLPFFPTWLRRRGVLFGRHARLPLVVLAFCRCCDRLCLSIVGLRVALPFLCSHCKSSCGHIMHHVAWWWLWRPNGPRCGLLSTQSSQSCPRGCLTIGQAGHARRRLRPGSKVHESPIHEATSARRVVSNSRQFHRMSSRGYQYTPSKKLRTHGNKETIQSGSAFSAHPSVTLNMPQKCPASPFDAMRLFFGGTRPAGLDTGRLRRACDCSRHLISESALRWPCSHFVYFAPPGVGLPFSPASQ